MSQQELEKFGAYRKADELFDLVVEDVMPLRKLPECWKLISQQIAAADSICANIEEGFGREGTRELIQFLAIARASCREVRGRHHRLRHWLPPEAVTRAQSLCDEIIGILTRTIPRLRHKLSSTQK